MAKHTIEEMEKLPFEELKKAAAEPEEKEPEVKAQEPEPEAPESFLARREIDLEDGSGVQVFEAEGETREAALESLADKITDAQVNATKKIREQEAELRGFRARNAEPQKPKEVSADEEYILSQEMLKTPTVAVKKAFKILTGFEIEEFASMKQAADAVRSAQQTSQGISHFLVSHPDYEDSGDAGTRNSAIMRMKLAELGLPATSENLSKAYSQLKQSGLLVLKGEEAQPDATVEAGEKERIVPPRQEAAPRATKKVSTIGTHSRATPVPVNTEPSEADAYAMPLEKLKELANRQLVQAR